VLHKLAKGALGDPRGWTHDSVSHYLKNEREKAVAVSTLKLRLSAGRSQLEYLVDLKEVDRTVLGVLNATGARIGEVASLRPEDVTEDVHGMTIRIGESKTQAGRRSVPVAKWAEASVKAIAMAKPLSPEDASRAFGALKMAQGFPASKVAHSIRHLTISTLGGLSFSTIQIQNRAGDSAAGSSVISRYLKAIPAESLRALVDALPALCATVLRAPAPC
jgi:integrase